MKNLINPLLSISPIDGRYQKETEELSKYFSEFAYIKYRFIIEVKYFISLSEEGVIRKFNKKEYDLLNDISNKFSLSSAEKIKTIEEKTKHDVKAIEYYIKELLAPTSLSDVSEFIHFGLTSEDINNIALRLMLRDLNEKALLPAIAKLNTQIISEYKKYKNLPMIARTHGQKAVPTTLGKEFLVFSERVTTEINYLREFKFKAKINGAIGNYNALNFAYPKVNWPNFSKKFLTNLKINTARTTTQIAPYEDIIHYFQTIQRVNGIILDLDQDLWRYISDGYFIQENVLTETGSSTMPQKVNPILFENSEGNIIVANSLIDGITNKLPVSRLQRDLSGSTISRNLGIIAAYSLLSYKNTLKGLLRLKANEVIIKNELNSDYSILSEAMQIYLKKEGIKNGYEILKELTKGQSITKEDWKDIINKLPINEKQKNELLLLTPEKYIGII